jgi:hypothetical protein
VPRAKRACGRVGHDADGMAVQPGRPALRLLTGLTTCMGRQLVPLRGTRNHSSTCRGGGARVPGSRRASWPTPQSESGGARVRRRLLMRGGDSSCEAETCRGGIPLVGNWSKMLPTGRKHDVLPVWVLTGSSVLLVLNLGLDIVNLGLHIVNGVGLPCVKGDLFAVEGRP